MKFKLPTEGIGHIILAAWIIFSVVFVANSIWQNYKMHAHEEVLKQGVTLGYQQAIADLMDYAETCEPFPIHLGDSMVQLQKADCNQ